MRIPTDAIISPSKLTDYLLKPRPEDDKSAFLARAGFTSAAPELLEAAIRRSSTDVEAIPEQATPWGTVYTLDSELIGPTFTALRVKLVWMKRTEGTVHFVTLIPRKEPGR